jgi:hypothetical protein
MKKILFIILSLMISFSYASEQPEQGAFWVDGQSQKSIEHLLPGQVVKVLVSSPRKGIYSTTGRIAEGKFKDGVKSLSLEHEVSKRDLRNGYVTIETYFKSVSGNIIGSYVKVIPVKTKKQIDALANETDEEKLKRVMKELGVDKDKCDSIFKN